MNCDLARRGDLAVGGFGGVGRPAPNKGRAPNKPNKFGAGHKFGVGLLTPPSDGNDDIPAPRMSAISLVAQGIVLLLLFVGFAKPVDAQPKPTAKAAKTSTGGGTRVELDAMIDRLGKTPPDWFKSTPLNYPPSLDLDWPMQPQGGWNNQKNVGQYLWDIVNPNPGRWKEGTKLVHHLLTLHANDPAK